MSDSDTPTGDEPQTQQAAKPVTSEAEPKQAPVRATRAKATPAKAAPRKAAPRKAAATRKPRTRAVSPTGSKPAQRDQDARSGNDPYQSSARVWPD